MEWRLLSHCILWRLIISFLLSRDLSSRSRILSFRVSLLSSRAFDVAASDVWYRGRKNTLSVFLLRMRRLLVRSEACLFNESSVCTTKFARVIACKHITKSIENSCNNVDAWRTHYTKHTFVNVWKNNQRYSTARETYTKHLQLHGQLFQIFSFHYDLVLHSSVSDMSSSFA